MEFVTSRVKHWHLIIGKVKRKKFGRMKSAEYEWAGAMVTEKSREGRKRHSGCLDFMAEWQPRGLIANQLNPLRDRCVEPFFARSVSEQPSMIRG